MAIRGFLGSSRESLEVARQFQSSLNSQDVILHVWEDCFPASSVVVDELLLKSREYDFAIFLFSPDDIGNLRGKDVVLVRDNVLFETGIFMNSIGRKRVFIIVPTVDTLRQHILSDLQGLVYLTYYPPNRPEDWPARIRPVCTKIQEALSGFSNATDAGKRLKALKGQWLGRKIQPPFEEASAAIKFDVRGLTLIGVLQMERGANGKGLSTHEIEMVGGFVEGSNTTLRFEYSDRTLPGAICFGVMLMVLDALGRNLVGQFVGFGPVSGKPVSGTIELEKAEHG